MYHFRTVLQPLFLGLRGKLRAPSTVRVLADQIVLARFLGGRKMIIGNSLPIFLLPIILLPIFPPDLHPALTLRRASLAREPALVRAVVQPVC